MSEFERLRMANFERNIEWAKDVKLSLSFRGNELAGEVGEACNVLKKLDRESLGLVGSRAPVSALLEELADIIICVDLIAMDLNLNLWSGVVDKFNATSKSRGLKTELD